MSLNDLKNIFVDREGRLRAVWQLGLAVMCWYAVYIASAVITSRLLLRMFAEWGVTNANIALMPAWVQFLAAYQSRIAGAAASGICLCAALPLLKKYPSAPSCTPAPVLKQTAALCCGIVAAMAFLGIFLIADSVRVTRTAPRFTADIPLMLVYHAIAAAAECMVSFGYVRRMTASHAGRIAGHIAASIFFASAAFVASGVNLSALGIINCLLAGLLLSFISERYGHVTCAALRTGWLWAIGWLAGFVDNTAAMYTAYPDSERFLTGGFCGPDAGFAATLALAALLVIFIYPTVKPFFEIIVSKKHTR